MDLLESSFSYNSEDFDSPLIPIPTKNNLVTSASFNSLNSLVDNDESELDYQFFSNLPIISSNNSNITTTTIDLLTSSPLSSIISTTLEIKSNLPPPPRTLILSSNNNNLNQTRINYVSSIVKNPSPLKQMSSFNSSLNSSTSSTISTSTTNHFDNFEIGLGVPPLLLRRNHFEQEEQEEDRERDLLDESMQDEMGDRTEGNSIREMEERDMTPIKRAPKKWAIVSKARASLANNPTSILLAGDRRVSRSRSISPMKELLISGTQVEDADSSLAGFGASAYDLLLEEDSPDLLNELSDLTVAPASASLYLDEQDDESSLDMQNILRGLNAPSTSSTSNPKTTSTSTKSSRLSSANLNSNNTSNNNNENSPPRFGSNLLASSTASYREYRDSPVRVVSHAFMIDQIEEEEEGQKTPMKSKKLSNWQREKRDSSEEIEGGTGDMVSMLREWKDKHGGDGKTEEINAQATPTAFRHLNLEPTMTMEMNLISPTQPTLSTSSTSSTLSTTSSIPSYTKPKYSRDVSLSPEMIFSNLKVTSVTSNATARNVLGVLNRIEARIDTLASGVIKNEKEKDLVVLENYDHNNGKIESGTERLRRKIGALSNGVSADQINLVNATPARLERKRFIPVSINSSGTSRNRMNRLPTSTSNSTLSEIYDDSVGTTISTSISSTSLSNSSSIIAPTPIKRIPRVSTSFLPSATPRLIPATPRLAPGTSSSSSIFTKEKESERKDTTRERLEKAREERARREEARSPVKTLAGGNGIIPTAPVSVSTSTRRPSTIIAPMARIALPSSSNSSALASTSNSTTGNNGRTTLEQALKLKPTSLASKYKFTPTVIARSRASSTSSRLPSTSTSTSSLVRQKSSSSSPPKITSSSSSNISRPPLSSMNGDRKVLSSSTGANSGLKRSGSITSSTTSTTGLKIPRSRTSLLPTTSAGSGSVSGIKRPGA